MPGWRGTIGRPSDFSEDNIPGIAANAVRIMVNYGADKNKIQVAIGASIHSCCFEVKNDFYNCGKKKRWNVYGKFYSFTQRGWTVILLRSPGPECMVVK